MPECWTVSSTFILLQYHSPFTNTSPLLDDSTLEASTYKISFFVTAAPHKSYTAALLETLLAKASPRRDFLDIPVMRREDRRLQEPVLTTLAELLYSHSE